MFHVRICIKSFYLTILRNSSKVGKKHTITALKVVLWIWLFVAVLFIVHVLSSNVLFVFFPELQEPATDKLEEGAVLPAVVLPSNPVEIEIETPEQLKKRERR